jgi:hypothetical protein
MRLTANHLAVVFLRARVAYPCRVMTHPERDISIRYVQAFAERE